jgi:hypothetical protein
VPARWLVWAVAAGIPLLVSAVTRFQSRRATRFLVVAVVLWASIGLLASAFTHRPEAPQAPATNAPGVWCRDDGVYEPENCPGG